MTHSKNIPHATSHFSFLLDEKGDRIPVKEFFCPRCQKTQMYYEMEYGFGCGVCKEQSFIDKDFANFARNIDIK